jgi:hypothetical protein
VQRWLVAQWDEVLSDFAAHVERTGT